MFVVEGSGLVGAQGNEVWVGEVPRQSSKFNALWKANGISLAHPSPLCFTITVLAGEAVWAGLTTERHFGAGWACKALSYGGNVSDGGGLLRPAFGPRLNAGSVCTVGALVVGSTLSVSLAVDGKGLGEAFRIDLTEEDGPFFPLVSFSTAGARARITMEETIPDFLPAKREEGPRTSIVGEWALATSAIVSDPPAGFESLTFTVTESPWAITTKVANVFRRSLSPAAPHGGVGPPISTRMMPPPPLQPLESKVGALLESVTSLALQDGGSRLEMTCGPETFSLAPVDEAEARPAPVTRAEVAWLRHKTDK